jgi:hypothetical protein
VRRLAMDCTVLHVGAGHVVAQLLRVGALHAAVLASLRGRHRDLESGYLGDLVGVHVEQLLASMDVSVLTWRVCTCSGLPCISVLHKHRVVGVLAWVV